MLKKYYYRYSAYSSFLKTKSLVYFYDHYGLFSNNFKVVRSNIIVKQIEVVILLGKSFSIELFFTLNSCIYKTSEKKVGAVNYKTFVSIYSL